MIGAGAGGHLRTTALLTTTALLYLACPSGAGRHLRTMALLTMALLYSLRLYLLLYLLRLIYSIVMSSTTLFTTHYVMSSTTLS